LMDPHPDLLASHIDVVIPCVALIDAEANGPGPSGVAVPLPAQHKILRTQKHPYPVALGDGLPGRAGDRPFLGPDDGPAVGPRSLDDPGERVGDADEVCGEGCLGVAIDLLRLAHLDDVS